MKISKHFIRFNEFSCLYLNGNMVCVDYFLRDVPKHVDVYLLASFYGTNISRHHNATICSKLFHRTRHGDYFIRGLNYVEPEISEDY